MAPWYCRYLVMRTCCWEATTYRWSTIPTSLHRRVWGQWYCCHRMPGTVPLQQWGSLAPSHPPTPTAPLLVGAIIASSHLLCMPLDLLLLGAWAWGSLPVVVLLKHQISSVAAAVPSRLWLT